MKRMVLVSTAVFTMLFVGQVFAELPEIISRDIFFGNPLRSNPQISPDGKLITFAAPDDKKIMQIWIRSIGKGDDEIITADKNRGIRRYAWTYDSEQLVYLKDNDGDENWHLISVNVKTKLVRDLTPFQGVQARLLALDPNFSNEMLVMMNVKSRRKFDVFRINLKNGAVELDTENPGNISEWVTDAGFKIRAGTEMTRDGGFRILYRDAADQPWRTLHQGGPDDEIHLISLSKDEKTLYFTSTENAETNRLLSLDIASGKETVVAGDPQYDIGTGEFQSRGEGAGVLIQPSTREIQAVSIYKDKLTWEVIDKSIENDFDVLSKIQRGQVTLISRDLADKTWIVSYDSDNGPINYYIYDRASKTGKLLFSNKPELENVSLAKIEPISFQSRDRLTIHGYLTIPVGVQPENLPTVLLVHGGPWIRDTWGFNSTVQWLSNRGYAVLQVNYRGSSGYGKQFLNAGNREWGGKMQDDLVDGVNWVINEGIADPKKIAIMGRSYGGYATLVGLTFTPDVFAAGVDIVGPSNILSLLKGIPPHFAPMKAMFFKRVGDLDKDEALLTSRSPLSFVDRIKSPLLIIQGANDPRVKKGESDQIVKAMREKNKQVEYVVYGGEGHYFLRPENKIHMHGTIETFLAKHLGGRLEKIGEIDGHSAVIE